MDAEEIKRSLEGCAVVAFLVEDAMELAAAC
jgi:hypothetical protein